MPVAQIGRFGPVWGKDYMRSRVLCVLHAVMAFLGGLGTLVGHKRGFREDLGSSSANFGEFESNSTIRGCCMLPGLNGRFGKFGIKITCGNGFPSGSGVVWDRKSPAPEGNAYPPGYSEKLKRMPYHMPP